MTYITRRNIAILAYAKYGIEEKYNGRTIMMAKTEEEMMYHLRPMTYLIQEVGFPAMRDQLIKEYPNIKTALELPLETPKLIKLVRLLVVDRKQPRCWYTQEQLEYIVANFGPRVVATLLMAGIDRPDCDVFDTVENFVEIAAKAKNIPVLKMLVGIDSYYAYRLQFRSIRNYKTDPEHHEFILRFVVPLTKEGRMNCLYSGVDANCSKIVEIGLIESEHPVEAFYLNRAKTWAVENGHRDLADKLQAAIENPKICA
jgi:hypothetical protein